MDFSHFQAQTMAQIKPSDVDLLATQQELEALSFLTITEMNQDMQAHTVTKKEMQSSVEALQAKITQVFDYQTQAFFAFGADSTMAELSPSLDRLIGINRTLEFYMSIQSENQAVDVDAATLLDFKGAWPIYVNIIAAMTCLGFSSFYHLGNAKSQHMHNLLVRLDYAGISFLILGSVFAPVSFTFACGDALFWGSIMNGFMTLLCSTAFILCLLPMSQKKGFYKFRMAVFLTAGVSCVIPLIVNLIYQPQNEVLSIPIGMYGIGGAFYIVGALIYGF